MCVWPLTLSCVCGPQAVLGSQYGERPLPRLLPEPLFKVLEAGLTPDDLQLLGQWFLRDTNAVPPTYVLQPIRSLLPSYGEPGAGREASSASWRSTEARLQTALRRAASEAQVKGHLTPQQTHCFYQSGDNTHTHTYTHTRKRTHTHTHIKRPP